MNVDITEKYFEKKRENILGYCMNISQIIKLPKMKIWNNKRALSNCLGVLIKYFINNAMLTDDKNKFTNDKLEINHILIKELDSLDLKYSYSYVLKLTISALKMANSSDKIHRFESEILYVGVLLWIGLNVDYCTCSLYNIAIDFRKYLKSMLKTISNNELLIVKMEDNKGINSLVKDFKKALKDDEKFFESLSDDESFNKYVCLSKEKKMYLTKYFILIDELNKYKDLEINDVYEKECINKKTYEISALLLNTTILKQILLEKDIGFYFLPFVDKYFTTQSSMEKFSKIISNKYVKSKVGILIKKIDVDANVLDINALRKKDYLISMCVVDTLDDLGQSLSEAELL